MASSSKDSSSHERRSSSHSASQQKLPWNPVLKTDRPKYGYAREPPAPKKESPRAPEKRPAVPRFRHPPHPPAAPRGEEEFEHFERRPAVPRFRHPPERETKEDHPLIRGLERRVSAHGAHGAGLESAQGVQENRSELRPVKCRYCAQLLVVASQQQHERSCFERMLDLLPGDDQELPSARSQRPVRRSRSSSADVVAAVGGAEPSWVPSEQLRSRAQRHQQQVHAATKEAMVAEEDEENGIMLTVDALEVDFKSFAKELSSLALPSAALALMGQLASGCPQQQTALDQLIDLQRRHSVLGSILRLAEEHRTSKAPPFGPHPLAPHTPTGWPPPPVQNLSSSAETPRKGQVPSTLPPLHLEEVPARLSRSSSRSDASLRSASVASRRTLRVRGRQRSGSVKSARSATNSRCASRASRASRGRVSRVSRSASEVTLRASPGPAAVGFRDMSLEEMKAEIEAERQKYIAERLSAAAR